MIYYILTLSDIFHQYLKLFALQHIYFKSLLKVVKTCCKFYDVSAEKIIMHLLF